ncbi:MAG TPA: PKD domain-containing protein, partial [Thermoplasmatales archaeon]|nr:PKD domain-containing protein [Thermoplasmatales archaeon]
MKKSFSKVLQVVSMVLVLFLSGCLFTEEPVVDKNTQMNHAPSPPQVNFNSSLERAPGVFYLVTASSTDVDEDNITYCFDFGDGTWFNSTSFFESGETIRQHHSWDSQGDYTLRVRASD